MIDHQNLFGYLNPYLYVLFLIIYHFNNNQSEKIFLGFIFAILPAIYYTLKLIIWWTEKMEGK